MPYPNRLRAYRAEHNLRLSDVVWVIEQSTGLKLSEAMLPRLERGENLPPLTTLAAIARALDEDPAVLWSPDEAPYSAVYERMGREVVIRPSMTFLARA